MSRWFCWPTSIHTKDTRWGGGHTWLGVWWVFSWYWWVFDWYSNSKEAEHWPATPGEMRDEGCENKIKLAEKQRDISWKAATSMATGKQTKPLPPALLRGRAGSPLPMWSQHKQARTKDFKAATHKRHTQRLSETSPVMWLRPGALRLGPWQSNVVTAPVSFDQQPIRGSPSFEVAILGAQTTSQIGWAPAALQYAHPLPTALQQASHSHSYNPFPPPSLSSPARWDQTHARCLINTKTCQRCPVSCEESWETSNYHRDL